MPHEMLPQVLIDLLRYTNVLWVVVMLLITLSFVVNFKISVLLDQERQVLQDRVQILESNQELLLEWLQPDVAVVSDPVAKVISFAARK